MIQVYNLIPFTGYGYSLVREKENSKKENNVNKSLEIIKKIKQETKKIIQIYNIKGQIIEYDKHGKHLDVFV